MGPVTIKSQSEFELRLEIAQVLEDALHDCGLEDTYVEAETLNKGFKITAVNSESESFPISHTDLTIYQDRGWSPPELDQIRNISRWFPNKTLDVPVVDIQIKAKNDLSSYPKKLNSISSSDHVLRGIIHLSDFKETELMTSASGSEFVLTTNDIEGVSAQEFIEYLSSHITSLQDDDLYSEDELRSKLSDFNPDVFHFNEVLNAYQESRTKLLIILLSVFFEGYVEELLSEAMEDARENEHAGRFYEDLDFKASLDACRFFGLIGDNEYRIIDQIRDERNDYAHEHEKYHPDITSEVSRNGTLEDAIELYEEIIGVKDSMLSDNDH